MIADVQDDQQCDQVNEDGDDLPEKMRDSRAPFLFPVGIPKIAIEKRYDERGAEKKERGADMFAPVGLHAVERNGGVKRERETKKLEEKAEAHAGSALEKTTDGKHDEIRRHENDGGHKGLLALEKLQHRQC